jgi:hypothetical protein
MRGLMRAFSEWVGAAVRLIDKGSLDPQSQGKITWAAVNYQKVSGPVWNGLLIRPIGSSSKSIDSTLDDYEILPGLYDVPISAFSADLKNLSNHFYSADDIKRANKLTETIDQNKEIEPLIVVMDNEGPYILEGAHRTYALVKLGFDSLPAQIVMDKG